MFIPCLDEIRYRGTIGKAGRQVSVDVAGNSSLLNPYIEIAAYSPVELGWGFAGAAARQTALAMTADYFSRIQHAQRWPYQIPVSDMAIAIHGVMLKNVVSILDMNQNWALPGQFVWLQLEASIKEIQLEAKLRSARIVTIPVCGQDRFSEETAIEWSF
jgi:hypothetical protein